MRLVSLDPDAVAIGRRTHCGVGRRWPRGGDGHCLWRVPFALVGFDALALVASDAVAAALVVRRLELDVERRQQALQVLSDLCRLGVLQVIDIDPPLVEVAGA